MLRFKTSAAYVVSFLLISGVLFLAPIIPTSTVFAWSSLSNGDSRNLSSLNSFDLDSVLRVVKAHEMYGVREGMPITVSLYDLLSKRQRFGIFSIRDVDARELLGCPECALVVDTGIYCGGFCGSGTKFYLARRAGQWEVREFSLWVS
jgi:hypothetical protein